MTATTTLVSMAHERKVENLRTFMVNLANSRGFSLPETKLFDQKFLDLCLYRTPDHPTYSAMIFVAITDLNEEGGSGEEAISEFIKSKYKNLPFAHRSLLSHHLTKLVEKREILCDSKNYCYSLPGEKKSDAIVSIDAERKSLVITLSRDDQCAANEAVTHQNKEESVRMLKSMDNKEDLLEERSLTVSENSPKRKACCDINVIEVSHTEDNEVDAWLRDSPVETHRIEGVAKEPEVALEPREIVGRIEANSEGVALEPSEIEGRIEANNEGIELYEIVVLDEQNDIVIEDSGEGEKSLRGIISKERKTELLRTSNTVKEACVEVKSGSYKRLWECQTEACSNIIALEKMLKQCREKDQQKKAVSETDDRLPLSMESCKELRKLAQKIESQFSEIIDSTDEAVVPYTEPRGCEIRGKSEGSVHEGSNKRKTCENNGSETTSKQPEEKEREIDLQKKQQAKKTRVKRRKDIGTIVLRKSPIVRKPI
ncbi:hypothetical protein AALP_AA8G084500 [Arabis alpina]|uniref:H15 domain-containing protein n=1 Tax=Arabis alpina TaxID=50452 RepID=A0A087G5T0_ARAAL|nr:hypothetical protein AALP_AA8G084500 [Arabis alpina]